MSRLTVRTVVALVAAALLGSGVAVAPSGFQPEIGVMAPCCSPEASI